MSSAPSFEARKEEYSKWWKSMVVKSSRVSSVASTARRLLANRSHYDNVERRTGVPWYMVAAIHEREASGNFAGCLHNGEHIIGTSRKTTLVPAGRGPFPTWDDSAYDALTMPPHSLQKVSEWSIERILYETEKYNGWGYWQHGDHTSAYLWAGSDIDHGGKYVADHVFDAGAQDAQNGAALVMHKLLELTNEQPGQSTPAPAPAPTPAPAPAPAPKPPVSVDPQKQIGGLLNILYKLIQSFLKRKP